MLRPRAGPRHRYIERMSAREGARGCGARACRFCDWSTGRSLLGIGLTRSLFCQGRLRKRGDGVRKLWCRVKVRSLVGWWKEPDVSAGLEWREPKGLNAQEQHPSLVDWAFWRGMPRRSNRVPRKVTPPDHDCLPFGFPSHSGDWGDAKIAAVGSHGVLHLSPSVGNNPAMGVLRPDHVTFWYFMRWANWAAASAEGARREDRFWACEFWSVCFVLGIWLQEGGHHLLLKNYAQAINTQNHNTAPK